MESIKIISGRSNPQLAQNIAKYVGIPLVKCEIVDFANSEIYVNIGENIRGCIVFFIQTGANSADGKHSINDSYVEAIQVADACRRSDAASIGIIYAAFPYARSDKKDKPRVSIMSSVIANGLKEAGYSRIICLDIHAGQTQGVVNIPFDNLYAIRLQIDYLHTYIFKDMDPDAIKNKFILISPDAGGIKRIIDFASRLKLSYAIMNKQRDYSKPNTVSENHLMGGDVTNKIAIIVDDMADTMGTMISAIKDLIDHGVKEVIIVVTHGILSGPAIQRINDCSHISRVIVTDTIDQSVRLHNCSKLEVVSTAELFGEVIKRVIYGGSISDLFK